MQPYLPVAVGEKFDKETDGTSQLPVIFSKQADIERGWGKKLNYTLVYIF